MPSVLFANNHVGFSVLNQFWKNRIYSAFHSVSKFMDLTFPILLHSKSCIVIDPFLFPVTSKCYNLQSGVKLNLHRILFFLKGNFFKSA